MRKRIIAAAIIIMLLSPACAAGVEGELEDISDALGVDVTAGTVLAHTDTHGGFHGDGVTYIAIRFPDGSREIAGSSVWKPLPLSKPLTALAYGLREGKAYYGPYLTDGDHALLFPRITNGYYYFEDRHPESGDRYDDTGVLNRASFNFTLAIYDADTHYLHYCEFDT